jgi:hypothetical protein
MEIINEDGKKIGRANEVEKAMTGGQTFNFIICKDCKSEHKNVEEWTSLCVPLPESIPTRKVGVEFLPFALDQ